jgi:hypothetical protein
MLEGEEMKTTLDLCKEARYPLMSFEGVTYVSPELERLIALIRADERAAPVQEPVAWIWKYANGEEEVVFVPPRHVDASHVDAPSTITPLYTTPPAAPDLQAELDATNGQVEILSDALAESRREVAAKDEALKLIERLVNEADLCRNEGANDIAALLDEAAKALAAPVQSCYCPNCEAMGKELAALKAQPTVPDALFRHAPEHPQYIEGWNDCRAEMLKGIK